MSEETKHLKLFKYDKETDDFNTTTFNIKKCLNDNWDKIDSKYEDTTKELTEIKETDKKQQSDIELLQFKTQVAGYTRVNKSDGIFTDIVYYDKDNKRIGLSKLQNPNSEGQYLSQTIYIYKDAGSSTVSEVYKFKLEYDSDGDLIARKLVV
ncbi:hypothetical protein CF088_16375 [Clostridium botulinum]|uniref:Uncharacterized protein n=1 Tax=Clostridium botulinum CFSAN001627 TaxID=1232189 RepID=M1ZR01_CLOBO|nr:hypothetical protein [Clostridium botulinum]EKN36339.1 hypothetical protein CFSAN001627_27058 [Clostridium botulinum CFSAN001627]APH22834.1 hypothetical protein NPD1_2913 [Clostridium botulinum]APQ68677.1 hypothetical protein RSJ8_1039 [Clostridium botulinum]MBN3380038.1 hypothetical protein [Clostridium botulinum]MBN3385850.1 hypothetical protein [Clostridium botulinum]